MRPGRRTCSFALGLLLLRAAPGQAEEPLSYTVDATGVAKGRVRITLMLPVALAAPVDLVMPRSYPGGYSTVLYDRFVQTVETFSPSGASLSVAPAEYGPRWRLGRTGERVAKIAYEVDVARMERELPSAIDASKVRSRYAGLLGYSVFAFVDGFERHPVSLSVLAPEGWPVLTTLAPSVPAPVGTLSARAADYDALADSEILMGPGLALTRLPGAIPLVMAVYAECEEDLALEGALARTALDRVQAYFGDVPLRSYTVQLELLKPLPDHGYGFSQEHVDSGTFSLSEKEATTEKTSEDQRLRTLLNYAHHMAHSWIPKRAYGPGYSPYTWELTPALDTVWFNEGFGRYAAIQAVADGMSPADGAAVRARSLARLKQILDQAPPFLQRMSLLDLSRTASFLYSADFRVGRNTFARGALMAAEMDDRIRAASGGTRSLRGALRALLRTPQPFRIGDLPRIFREATGVDVGEILDRWMK